MRVPVWSSAPGKTTEWPSSSRSENTISTWLGGLPPTLTSVKLSCGNGVCDGVGVGMDGWSGGGGTSGVDVAGTSIGVVVADGGVGETRTATVVVSGVSPGGGTGTSSGTDVAVAVGVGDGLAVGRQSQ